MEYGVACAGRSAHVKQRRDGRWFMPHSVGCAGCSAHVSKTGAGFDKCCPLWVALGTVHLQNKSGAGFELWSTVYVQMSGLGAVKLWDETGASF